MLAINYSTMRSNLKEYCDKVSEDHETVIITRKDERNVVLVSLEDYNNLVENNYIMSNHAYYERLLESRRQIERGKVVRKTQAELEAMTDEKIIF